MSCHDLAHCQIEAIFLAKCLALMPERGGAALHFAASLLTLSTNCLSRLALPLLPPFFPARIRSLRNGSRLWLWPGPETWKGKVAGKEEGPEETAETCSG